MDYRYETKDEARDFHKQRKAFIILNEKLDFLPEGSSMSHYEYCQTKGLSKEEFNKITRGYYLNGNVIFYKDNFIYDEEVISNALKVVDEISQTIGVHEFKIYFGQLPEKNFALDYYYGKYKNRTIIKSMLSKPDSGWSIFQLGKCDYHLSYLTDVPTTWLDNAIYGLENLTPFSVYGYLEPDRVICTVSFWNSYVYAEGDDNIPIDVNGTHFESVHISMLDFCESLYNDINANIDEWVEWLCDDDIDLDERKKLLEEKLEKLNSMIDEDQYGFREGSVFI